MLDVPMKFHRIGAFGLPMQHIRGKPDPLSSFFMRIFRY